MLIYLYSCIYLFFCGNKNFRGELCLVLMKIMSQCKKLAMVIKIDLTLLKKNVICIIFV